MHLTPLESSLFSEPPSKKKPQRDASSLELEPSHKKRKIKILAKAAIDSSNQNFYQRNRVPEIKKLTYPNGSSYEGQLVNGLKHGIGKCTYPSGAFYEGEWAKDLNHGKGTYIQVDGLSYKGDWAKDMRHGKGILIYPDGSSYEGDWVEDAMHGKGIFRYPDGSSYEGDWVQGARHGRGIFRYPDGSSYEGDWVQGARHGRGTFTYSNQSTYEGGWANDVKHGKGTLTYPNGLLCKGEWVNDQIITNIQNLSDDLFFDLLCGSRENLPPNGYCLGIIQDYLQKKGLVEMADSLKKALECAFLNEAEAEKESHIIYDELNKKNRSRLICYGYKDHEMGLKLIPGVFPEFIVCKLFNTGIGLDLFHEVHPSDPNKFKLQLEVKVPIDSLNPEIIKKLILSVSNSNTIHETYDHVLNLPGREILPSDSSPWKKRQKGNDCTLRWIEDAYLDAEMPQEQAEQTRQHLKQACIEARIAKQGTSLENESI